MTQIRLAICNGTLEDVAQYLPQKYQVIGRTVLGDGVIIAGTDWLGWTLDEYVIPRLASGLITCTEIKI
jgi:FAD synthase